MAAVWRRTAQVSDKAANSRCTSRPARLRRKLPRAVATERTNGRRKLLIVDDNVDAAVSLRMLLELDGHEVEVAHDGDAGLKRLAEIKPEVALLDIGLPGMDGYELARRIRDNGEANVWLVAVSGYGQEHHQRSAQEAGFDRYLVKPVDFDALSRLLNELPEPARIRRRTLSYPLGPHDAARVQVQYHCGLQFAAPPPSKLIPYEAQRHPSRPAAAASQHRRAAGEVRERR